MKKYLKIITATALIIVFIISMIAIAQKHTYNSEAVLAINCDNSEIIYKNNAEKRLPPASLGKLFVIEYANTLTPTDEIVIPSEDVYKLTKPNSSLAYLNTTLYYIENLYAAMLVPSGNDAAYAVADFCGKILSPDADILTERVTAFTESLNKYLQKQGYSNTYISDVSGYDDLSYTTAEDLQKVTLSLLKNEWFREIIKNDYYTAIMPNDKSQSWENTNKFLDSSSDFYNENVVGVKTGSLNDNYNLITLYNYNEKEILIITLAADSDFDRYNDTQKLCKKI